MNIIRKKNFSFFVSLLFRFGTALLLCFFWVGLSFAFSLRLLHLNDSHSHLDPEERAVYFEHTKNMFSLGGAAHIAGDVHKAAAGYKNVLFLHAGDSVRGTAYYTTFGGIADMDVLNALGIQAMSLGNHEFDDGADHLATLLERVHFPILSANIKIRPGSVLDGKVRPWVLFDIDGVRIGVFGLTIPSTATISSPGPDVTFSNTTKAARHAVEQLRRQGAQIVIALTHQGYDKDKQLARTVSGIDVIVGGHSHSLLGPKALQKIGFHPEGPYPTVIFDRSGKSVYVVQADHNFRALGVLDIEYNEKKGTLTAVGQSELVVDPSYTVTSKGKTSTHILSEHNPFDLMPVKQDTDMAKLVQGFSDQIGGSDVLTRLARRLYHRREPDAQGHGSQVAPLVAQALFHAAEQYGAHVDAALINAGGIRGSLPQGDVTERSLVDVLPFENTVVLVRLLGRELKQVIQHGIRNASGAFPYVYGLQIKACPKSKKGWNLTGLNLQLPGKTAIPVDDDSHYIVVTISYLAGGGDGYPLKGIASEPLVPQLLDSQAMAQFLRDTPLLSVSSPLAITPFCPTKDE